MQPNPEPAPRPAPPTWADQQLAALRDRHPGWHLWYVRDYAGSHTWCAKPDGALIGEFQTYSPDALTQDITRFEATLTATIDDTRKELANLPDHSETPARRRLLNARLEALQRLQARNPPA